MSESTGFSPDQILDTAGAVCPQPVIDAKRATESLERGQVLKVVTDCLGAEDDLRAWAKQTDRELLQAEDLGGHKKAFYIRNGDPWPFERLLDMRGVPCPTPVVELGKAVEAVGPGHTVKLIADCNAAPDEIATWSNATGHTLLGTIAGASGSFIAYVRS